MKPLYMFNTDAAVHDVDFKVASKRHNKNAHEKWSTDLRSVLKLSGAQLTKSLEKYHATLTCAETIFICGPHITLSIAFTQ